MRMCGEVRGPKMLTAISGHQPTDFASGLENPWTSTTMFYLSVVSSYKQAEVRAKCY